MGGRHNMPLPLQVGLWPFHLESVVRVTCDVSYLRANFSLPRPLIFDLGPMYATDRRQTRIIT